MTARPVSRQALYVEAARIDSYASFNRASWEHHGDFQTYARCQALSGVLRKACEVKGTRARREWLEEALRKISAQPGRDVNRVAA